MTKRGGSNGIEPADQALWEAVKKSVKPLKIAKPRLDKPIVSVARNESSARTHARSAKSQPAPTKSAASKPPPLAPLDRRTRSRVARGSIEIDARLDLHGLTLERARSRLNSFLTSSQARGASLVLVITGKGGTGALRRETPFWLSSPEMRPIVIGFEEAAQHHGGSGALYVRIRRARS